ncbi:alpha/beta hydrolase [Gordonia rubripertincta]|uniref:alpha/beta hydrolase n=1 Tax=Gordonia rubripertincta TaxID=36822 RepID=UPI000B8DA16F|nr:alpha/beta hydrolase family protein [Gordonia rubripertincta]ASR02405.1 Diacylglycerol acyltransferase/mycolyltransferase Ag85A precursor [Gordonia rubripertincta]
MSHSSQASPSEAPSPKPRRLSPRRRVLTGISVVAILTLGLFGASTLFDSSNTASALRGHPEKLRPGCTWDSSGYFVQNCKVWSESQQRHVIVQIRASSGSDSGVYLLDGMRASETRSAWTTDVQAARVYDAKADTTLVMPVGGASSFYTDWDGGAGSNNTIIKQETFLTSELPAYLEEQFGVARNNNAIVGLSMSGGPAVTLAERHPEQFKVVQAMSGYYQTDNPIGALGVFATQSLVSNYVSGIVNMWGKPGGTRWTDNDPSKNVGKLAENGQVLVISSGNGFLTPSELAKLAPQDQISAIALEILSAVSTVLMQLQAKQSGASVISLPNYGGHTWENWGRALGDGKGHVLEALRNNPPVTAKTTVVSASGSPDPEAPAKVTMAVKQAVAASPALDATVLAALESTDASSPSSETSSSESAGPSDASESAAPSSDDVSASVPAAPESAAAESAAPAEQSAATTTDPSAPEPAPSAPPVSEQPASSTTTTTPVR